MRSRDVRATTTGLLFIAATATSLIATAFLGSLLDGPGFLATVSLHQDRMLTAALFQLIAAFSCAAIAVALYPVLREHAAGMALGAVAFRLIEGVFYALSAAGTMILVSLSGQLTAGASANASADLVRDLRDSAGGRSWGAARTGTAPAYRLDSIARQPHSHILQRGLCGPGRRSAAVPTLGSGCGHAGRYPTVTMTLPLACPSPR
jgi:Domain of unknown function (DUF4386)